MSLHSESTMDVVVREHSRAVWAAENGSAPCTECDGDGRICRLIQKRPLNETVVETCSACGGTGLEADRQWREDHAEAADNLATAELIARCEGDGDLVAGLCDFLREDHDGLTADAEGYIAWLIRTGNPIFWQAFERGFATLRKLQDRRFRLTRADGSADVDGATLLTDNRDDPDLSALIAHAGVGLVAWIGGASADCRVERVS